MWFTDLDFGSVRFLIDVDIIGVTIAFTVAVGFVFANCDAALERLVPFMELVAIIIEDRLGIELFVSTIVDIGRLRLVPLVLGCVRFNELNDPILVADPFKLFNCVEYGLDDVPLDDDANDVVELDADSLLTLDRYLTVLLPPPPTPDVLARKPLFILDDCVCLDFNVEPLFRLDSFVRLLTLDWIVLVVDGPDIDDEVPLTRDCVVANADDFGDVTTFVANDPICGIDVIELGRDAAPVDDDVCGCDDERNVGCLALKRDGCAIENEFGVTVD